MEYVWKKVCMENTSHLKRLFRVKCHHARRWMEHGRTWLTAVDIPEFENRCDCRSLDCLKPRWWRATVVTCNWRTPKGWKVLVKVEVSMKYQESSRRDWLDIYIYIYTWLYICVITIHIDTVSFVFNLFLCIFNIDYIIFLEYIMHIYIFTYIL